MANETTEPAGRKTTINQRMQVINDRTNSPMTCPECGGTFFFQVRAEEFSNSGYGSAQIRSLSMNQEVAYLCLCGQLVDIKEAPAGRGSESQRARFLASLQNALKAHTKNNLQEIAREFASVHELKAATARIEWLEECVESLASAAASVETEVQSDPAPAGEGAGQPAEESQEPEQAIEQTRPETKGGRGGKGRAGK